jgi:hypothetical protein
MQSSGYRVAASSTTLVGITRPVKGLRRHLSQHLNPFARNWPSHAVHGHVISSRLLPSQSSITFEKFLALRNQRVARLTVPDGIDAMLAFYEYVRAEGCDLAHDGDMLLYQYGTWDRGEGRHFELDITRQFIVDGGEDEDIWQLSLTFVFAPSPALLAVKSDNRWCHAPDELDEFRSFILAAPAYVTAVAMPILRVDFDYGCAG